MRALAVTALVVLGAVGCHRSAPPPIVPLGGDFTLTDQNGRPFTLSSVRGKVALVFFGYTFCPDVCPTTLSKLSAVTRALGDDRRRVIVVYVSVDPARDTPAALKTYLASYAVDAVGLTGKPDAVAAVAKQYGAGYEIEPTTSAASYFVAHSTTLYALDAQGQTRLLFRYEAPVSEIVEGIRSIL